MNRPGHKHHTLYGFGDTVYHRVTNDEGLIVGIVLRPNCEPIYRVIFKETRIEESCAEFELRDSDNAQIVR